MKVEIYWYQRKNKFLNPTAFYLCIRFPIKPRGHGMHRSSTVFSIDLTSEDNWLKSLNKYKRPTEAVQSTLQTLLGGRSSAVSSLAKYPLNSPSLSLSLSRDPFLRFKVPFSSLRPLTHSLTYVMARKRSITVTATEGPTDRPCCTMLPTLGAHAALPRFAFLPAWGPLTHDFRNG